MSQNIENRNQAVENRIPASEGGASAVSSITVTESSGSDFKIQYSIANSRKAFRWKKVSSTWGAFCEYVSHTKRTAESVAEYARLSKGKRDDIKDVGGFVFGTLKGGRRKKETVESRTGLTLDMDYGDPEMDVAGTVGLLYGCVAMIYSTHKHTPEAPRLRIVIPLSRPVTPDEYSAVARRVAEDIGIELFDDTTYEPHRMMYWPSTSCDGEYVFKVLEGERLNPDDILATYEDWHDMTSWPVSDRQKKIENHAAKKQEDPLTKQGIIGAFCRVYYPIDEAISEFLSDIYKPCDTTNLSVLGTERYDYIPADSSAGVLIYDGKYVYSHHATDPACGQLLNAFDLVRIHKFGEADKKADEDSEESKLPSYKKMQEFAAQLPSVKAQLAKERMERIREDFAEELMGDDPFTNFASAEGNFAGGNPAECNTADDEKKGSAAGATSVDIGAEASGDAFFSGDVSASSAQQEDDTEWQQSLEVTKGGTIKDTLENISTILAHDKNLRPIAYNKHRDGIDVSGPIPWKQVKPGWNDTDNSSMLLYINRYYGLYSPSKTKVALQAVTAARAYHPIQSYLESLPPWDGVPRAESLLIDYLGAEDSSYTRSITRKMLAAAVARVYTPGIKFDYVVILSGPQGIGKSTLFSRLGGKWFSDSLSMTDMKDKSGPEKLQGYWILELGELAGMKKTDVEIVKSFVSRTDDKYRAAYGVNVESHPRQCIIVGSTNADSGFLRDVTGNRRFWPVDVDGSGNHKPWQLDKATIEQVWAETLTFYKDETLYLVDVDAEVAEEKQAAALEADEREGLVKQYLDKLLPAKWDTLQPYDRRYFLTGEANTEEGIYQRQTVSNMEIWVECFGRDTASLGKADSYVVSGIMKRIPGWERTGYRPNIPFYGQQRLYQRVINETENKAAATEKSGSAMPDLEPSDSESSDSEPAISELPFACRRVK